MQNFLRDILDAKHRKKLYAAFGIIALILGAAMTGYNAADVAIPLWLEVANQVYWYVAAAFGVTAASNTHDTAELIEPGTGKRGIDREDADDHDAVYDIT